MLYQAYEAYRSLWTAWRLAAGLAKVTIEGFPGYSSSPLATRQSALLEVTMQTRLIHDRPAFDINQVTVGRRTIVIREETVLRTPFGSLIHFAKDRKMEEPRVLIVAALAGHFSTLMRDTIRTMLPDHDVYLADWNNARDVPLDAGRFGLDEYIDHVIQFLEELGPGTHLLAVCQPGPAAIAATAIMAERDSRATPRSLTLMASPIDTTSSPTVVNRLATSLPLSFFEHSVITTVPLGYEGYGRRVYPGFLQLSAFVSMNAGRHLDQHAVLYQSLVRGDQERARSIRNFYDEYFAVLDISADFYLDTIDAVFQRNLLANGQLQWKGQHVNPGKVKSTALLTVEGERDDVCGLGQTLAAHELFTGLEPSDKRHHLQVGVGHYGVFSGRRWQTETYPVVREFVLLHA